MEKEEKRADQENDGEEQSMRDIKPEEASLLKKKLHYYSGAGCRESCEVADDCCCCGMCYRSSKYAVLFCTEGCDKLQEREWLDVLSVACNGTDHYVFV